MPQGCQPPPGNPNKQGKQPHKPRLHAGSRTPIDDSMERHAVDFQAVSFDEVVVVLFVPLAFAAPLVAAVVQNCPRRRDNGERYTD